MSVNNIGGNAANYNIQTQRRARGADASGAAQRPDAEYDQSKYVRELNSRLNARVVPGAWDGKSSFGKDAATAMIHPDFLKKMHDDPALGAEYEKKINEWAEIESGIRERMEEQGNTITSLGMSVDKDGKETYHMAATYTREGPGGANNKQESAQTDDKKTFKEETEEMLKRLEEKRQKEKLESRRLAEQEAAAELISGKNTEGSRTIDRMA